METNDLVEQAAVIALNSLIPATVGEIGSLGKNLWNWIKDKAPSKKQPLIDSITSDPEDEGTKDTLRGVLKNILNADPKALAELQAMLKDAPQTKGTQTLRQSGDNNKGAQISGDKNRVRID